MLQKIPFYGDLDCFELAIQKKDGQICLKFISKRSVKMLIEKLWNGEWTTKNNYTNILKFNISILSFGLLSPFLMFGKTRDEQDCLDAIEYNERFLLSSFLLNLFYSLV